jgi:hypothetical protein
MNFTFDTSRRSIVGPRDGVIRSPVDKPSRDSRFAGKPSPVEPLRFSEQGKVNL